jgi:ATP-dependent DNA ligase
MLIELVKSDSAIMARIPDFAEPMKAKLIESIRPGDWTYEIKFDGYRALAFAKLESCTHLNGMNTWYLFVATLMTC